MARDHSTDSEFDMRNVCTCARCGLRYDWRNSASRTLKMTYCGSLCERDALGFTIEALLQMEAPPKRTGAEVPSTAVLADTEGAPPPRPARRPRGGP